MKVLGVDVGLRACGYVLCDVRGLDIRLIGEGQVEPNPAAALPQKLHHIYSVLRQQVQEHTPGALIVEKLYSHYRHPTTLGVLAHVRGIIALLAYLEGLDFYEYAPTRARKAFLGKGRSDSQQVKKMAENVTGRRFQSLHTADAYSLVVAFSHTQKFKKLFPDTCERRKHIRIPGQNIHSHAVSNSRNTEKKRRKPGNR